MKVRWVLARALETSPIHVKTKEFVFSKATFQCHMKTSCFIWSKKFWKWKSQVYGWVTQNQLKKLFWYLIRLKVGNAICWMLAVGVLTNHNCCTLPNWSFIYKSKDLNTEISYVMYRHKTGIDRKNNEEYKVIQCNCQSVFYWVQS